MSFKKLIILILFAQVIDLSAQEFLTALNGPYGARAFDIVRHSSGAIVIATANGLWRSTDAGGTWIRASTDADYFYSLQLDGPQNIYALTFGGIYKSTDAGATWSKMSRTGIPEVTSIT